MQRLPWKVYDAHVHCRDEEQSEKATIASTLELAEEQGVDVICDMPNTERPVISRQRVRERLALVPKGQEERYRLYVGLTGEEAQLEEALWCHKNIPEVVGIKLFAGKSVGSMSVIEEEDQMMIYRGMSKHGFTGVLLAHCEKEAQMRPEIWDPSNPISHTRARPKAAEIESVRDQIRFALEAGYTGKLHICHVSCPESVHLIQDAKLRGLRISCGATPHHLMWNENMMRQPDGLDYKMNPPLRSPEDLDISRWQLRTGMIDVIETDHAPHTEEEKKAPLCLSGYPSLTLFRQFVTEILPNLGLTQAAIKALTHDNILKIFGNKLKA